MSDVSRIMGIPEQQLQHAREHGWDQWTMTARELRVWLATQPDNALVVVSHKGEAFGIVGHAPASDPEHPVVVLV